MPYINGNKVMGISNIIISPSDPSGPTGPTEIPDYYKISNLNEFGTSEVEVDVASRSNFKNLFYQALTNITVEHLTINGSQDGIITSMYQCFHSRYMANDNKLKIITLNCDLSNCTDFYNMCNGLSALEVIDGTPIDFSSATSTIQIFGSCNKLKEFRVKPQTIKISLPLGTVEPISNDTIQSIVDGLADLKGQTSQTMTFGFDPSTKLTDAQKLSMTAKNWNVVLMD